MDGATVDATASGDDASQRFASSALPGVARKSV